MTHGMAYASKLLQEPPSVLRHWQEKLGIHVYRTKKGQRWFPDETIAVFRLAKQLIRKEGYTLAGAKARLEDMEGWK